MMMPKKNKNVCACASVSCLSLFRDARDEEKLARCVVAELLL
jgi:hypothetical protein